MMRVCLRTFQEDPIEVYVSLEVAIAAVQKEAKEAGIVLRKGGYESLSEEDGGDSVRFVFRPSGQNYDRCFADLEMVEVQE